VIPEFSWPDTGSSASGLRFWGAITDRDFQQVIGEVATWEFGYGP
jgi:hypothetical protein